MNPHLSVTDVFKSYLVADRRLEVLRGVNFQVQSGELAALVGPSGSGKSTLLSILGCIDAPDSGSVELTGVKFEHLNESERAKIRSRQLGFVFQNYNLVSALNAFENVELPLWLHTELSVEQRRDRARQCLKDVGMEDWALHFPDKMSGGQSQRVAIARALVTRPNLVLADEPTANLDSHTAQSIIDLMSNLNKHQGVTFLFSTHDEKLIRSVNRVVRLSDGVVSA